MTLGPETHETAPWMVFSATPLRRYSTSGCQLGMARAKFTGRFSLNGTGGCYPQITQMCADERASYTIRCHGARHLLLHLADRGRWVHAVGTGDVRELLRTGRACGPARFRDGVGGGESSVD